MSDPLQENLRAAGEGPARRPDRRVQAFVVAVILAGLAAGFVLRPVVRLGETALALGGYCLPTTCSFRLMFGLPCATCGLTRAVVLLLHGRLQESWASHPFGIPALALIVLALPPRVAGTMGRRPRWSRLWDRAWGWSVAAALLATLLWWTARMIAAWRGGAI
jgi:hypothetical protein